MKPIATTLKFPILTVVILALLPAGAPLMRLDKCIPGICYGYVQQSYVDSLVQDAFYGFNEAAAASSQADAKQKKQEAIAGAKEVAHKLRALAQNDPNQKYILWRLSELEGQIYLEEN
ncbi:MAG: hypothetical protein PHC61_11670, partial [Chitinivibrionales bacterium]|nr:hypothetical protein [Chitinivibrionales bacterium]